MKFGTFIGAMLILLGPLARPVFCQDAAGKARDFVDDIGKKLNHVNPKVKIEGTKELASIANGLRAAIGRLQGLVEFETNQDVRREATLAISEMGNYAEFAVPTLIRTLKQKGNPDDLRVALIGAIASTRCYSKEAIPLLIPLVRDKSPEVRRAAVCALGGYGPDAKEAVPALIAALSDPDRGIPRKVVNVRDCAIYALRKIGPDANTAADALLKIQESSDVDARAIALETLGQIAGKDRKVIATLVAVLKDKESTISLHRAAAYAVGAIGPDAKEAIPGLIELLKRKAMDDKAESRTIAVAWTLGRMGAFAKEAIPTLEEIRSSGDSPLRNEIDNSLKLIRSSK